MYLGKKLEELEGSLIAPLFCLKRVVTYTDLKIKKMFFLIQIGVTGVTGVISYINKVYYGLLLFRKLHSLCYYRSYFSKVP